MKKTLAAILAVGMIAGVASAQSNVLSQNAVGYVKVEVPSNGLNMVSTPFQSLSGETQTLGELFGNDIPDGANIYLWNSSTLSYVSYTYFDGLGWLDGAFADASTVEIPRGQGFWFRNPSPTVLDLTLMGEVPGSTSAAETSVELVTGLSMVTFAYPVEIDLGDAAAGLAASDGDIIYQWDPSGSYVGYTYFDGIGWLDGDFNEVPVLAAPGEAFWYRTTAGQTWTNTPPYSWPNN